MSEREPKSQEWAIAVQRTRRAGAFYWVAVRFFRLTLMPWLRVQKEGTHHLATPGSVILAPVHRSNLDSILLACSAERRLRALGK